MRRVRERESVVLKVLLDRRLVFLHSHSPEFSRSLRDCVRVNQKKLLVVYVFPRNPSRKPQSACEHVGVYHLGGEKRKQSLY